MRYGTTRAYIYSSSQIADWIIGQEKLNGIMTLTRARAYRATSTQAIPDATDTKVQFNAETFDPTAMFDSTTNYRLTVLAGFDGYFLIHAQLKFGIPAAASVFNISIWKNGALWSGAALTQAASGTNPTPQITDLLYLATADYIEIWTWVSPAASIVAGEGASFVDFIRIF